MNCWPVWSDSFCATARPSRSVGPPGGNGKITRTVLAGYVWAKEFCAVPAINTKASTTAVLKPRIPACLLSIAMMLIAAAPVVAQTYPAKSVRVIVPYPPGGGNDIIARAVVDELSRRTAQQFYVCLLYT